MLELIFSWRFFMRSLLFSLLILSQGASAVAQETSSQPSLLSFNSRKFNYHWDRLIPIDFSVDDIKIRTIFFNKREISKTFLKGAQFGTRSQIEVTNMSGRTRNPGFAVAVFDEKDNLLGVASGGTKIVSIKPGKTKKFDLNFWQVTERLQRGSYFYISIELTD
jgi:hypothetical protein